MRREEWRSLELGRWQRQNNKMRRKSLSRRDESKSEEERRSAGQMWKKEERSSGDVGEMRGVEDGIGNQRLWIWKSEWQHCRKEKQPRVFRGYEEMKTVRQRGRTALEEGRMFRRGMRERALRDQHRQRERESVALRHSAAATLTDSHSLTTDWLSVCLSVLTDWLAGCSSVPIALPFSLPPSLCLSVSLPLCLSAMQH